MLQFRLFELFIPVIAVCLVSLAARLVADAVVDTLIVSAKVLFYWL